MRRPTRRVLPAALLAAAVLAPVAPATAAELLYTVGPQNRLLAFGSDAPGALGGGEAIYGLGAGERIVDLDLRPRTEELYGVSTAGRLYRINPGSGRALAVGTAPFSPALESPLLGADFDGVADRVAVLTDTDQPLRVNPNDGFATDEGRLAYAADDVKAGVNPHITATAFTSSVAEARTNDQYAIDDVQRTLVRFDPAAPSVLRPGAPLTVRSIALPHVVGPVGFDIASDGRAYVSLREEAGGPPFLFRVDLATAALTPLGPIGPLTSRLRTAGLAAAGQVPDDTLPPLVVAAAPESQRLANVVRRGLRFELSCDESCTVVASLRIRDQVLARDVLQVAGAGKGRLRFAVNAASARRIVRSQFRRITLRLVVTDAAGNRRVQSENVTLVP